MKKVELKYQRLLLRVNKKYSKKPIIKDKKIIDIDESYEKYKKQSYIFSKRL